MAVRYTEDPQLKEKKSKNLLWAGIISIIMLFAGFTSAYIVIASDTFWVDIRMPEAFTYSLVAVGLGSASIFLSQTMIKKDKKPLFQMFLLFTFLLAGAFGYLQYQGWEDLFVRGNAVVGQVSSEGRYGANFTMTYKGDSLVFNGSQFFVNDEPLADDQYNDLKQAATIIADAEVKSSKNVYKLNGYDDFGFRFKRKEMTLKDGRFYVPFSDSLVPLSYDQRLHFRMFARNIRDGRGDFVMMGEYGKDYAILYKGQPLKYENRKLFKPDGIELSKVEYALLYKSRNTSSSFIYILTGLHLLHFAGGVLYLLGVIIAASRGRITAANHLKVKLAGMYWHFLGLLWVYLFAFLSFIH